MVGVLDRIFGAKPQQELSPALKRSQDVKKAVDLSTPVMEAEYVAFDTELTGLDFKRDSIVSTIWGKATASFMLPAKTW